MKTLLWILGVAALVVGLAALMGDRDHAESATARSSRGANAEPRARAGFDRADADVADTSGVWFEGRVFDREGLGVRDAIVSVDATPPQTAVTDARGIFTFPSLVPGTYRVVARARGGFAGPVQAVVSEHGEPLELRLQAAASLLVRVLDGVSEAVVTDAEVRVRIGARLIGRTDATGVVAFPAVPDGQHRVSVRAEGFADAHVTIPIASGNGEAEVRVRMARGEAVAGVVVDSAGTPIEAAELVVISPDGDRGDPIAVDQGRFALRVVPQRGLFLRGTAWGYAPGQVELADSAAIAGEVRVVLDRGRRIAGTVSAEDGAPIADANVRVTVAGDAGPPSTVTSARDGTFEIVGVPRDGLRVVAIHAQGSSQAVEVAAGEADVDALHLTLPSHGWIRGKVVDREGEPVANAMVIATPDLRGRTRGGIQALTEPTLQTSADEQGVFSFEGLLPGRYVLRGRPSDGVAHELSTHRGLTVSTGIEDARVVLAEGGTVRGRVIDAQGRPVARYQLRIDTARPRDVADAEGRFELVGVEAGRHYIAIAAPTLAGVQLDGVEVREAELTDLGDVQCAAGLTVAGHVVDALGMPVVGALVVVGDQVITSADGGSVPLARGGEGGFGATKTDAEGGFRLEGVEAGVQSVLATHPTLGRSRPMQVDGEAADLVLTLGGTSTISGVVRGPDGPLVGALVELVVPEAPRARQIVSTGEAGRFELSGLAAGSYRVSAKTVDRVDVQLATSVEIDLGVGAHGSTSLAIGQGSATLELSFVGAEPDAPEFDVVTVLAGDVQADDAGALDAAYLGRTGPAGSALSIGASAVTFEHLEEGRHSVCVTRALFDPEDPAQQRRVQLDAATLPVACKPVDLAAGSVTRLVMDLP